MPSNFVIHAPEGFLINWTLYHFDTPFVSNNPLTGVFGEKGRWKTFKGGHGMVKNVLDREK